MREFLFRGKRIDNGEWVEGPAINTQYDVRGEKHIYIGVLTTSDLYPLMQTIILYEVIPETIGQYTGLTDKDGKKIFEGDIVVVYARGYHTVCTVSWAETVAHFQLWQINTIPKTSTNLNIGNYDCEVIGNIHDNPELLKGGEG